MEIAISLATFLALLIIGVPIFWSFFISAIAIMLLLNLSPDFIPSVGFYAVYHPTLLIILYFILAGELMSVGGMAERMTSFANSLVGKIRGGLAAVGIVSSLFFAALTGSGIASVAGVGGVLIPRMEQYGYDRRYSTAVICSSSFLGYLIPPSIPVIIYAFVAQQSIAALFLSTVIPGILLAISYLLVNHFTCRKWIHPVSDEGITPKTTRGSIIEVGRTGFRAFPALLTPVIILGGIYGGVFTPTEAGAVAVVYALIAGGLIYRQMKLKQTSEIFVRTAITFGMMLIMLVFGMGFTRILVQQGFAEQMAVTTLGFSRNPYVILAMLNVLLLFLGMFIDLIVIIIVIVPLLLPLLSGMDFNFIHIGAVLIVNVGIGVITPPFAISLFLGSRVGNVPYLQLVRPVLPFLFFAAIPVLIITTYIPHVSLWLPTLIIGEKIVGVW
ncbi:TRAP transporter large permease [Chloroflexota bacterium]